MRAGGTVKQIAAGESGTAGTPNPQADDDDDDGLSSGALAVLLIAAGGAVVAAILATREDEINFGGTVSLSARADSRRYVVSEKHRCVLQAHGHSD